MTGPPSSTRSVLIWINLLGSCAPVQLAQPWRGTHSPCHGQGWSRVFQLTCGWPAWLVVSCPPSHATQNLMLSAPLAHFSSHHHR